MYDISPAMSPPAKTSVMFTYTVVWQASDVAWASRWDIYLQMSDVQIHWFAICNSVAIVLFLSGESNPILHIHCSFMRVISSSVWKCLPS